MYSTLEQFQLAQKLIMILQKQFYKSNLMILVCQGGVQKGE